MKAPISDDACLSLTLQSDARTFHAHIEKDRTRYEEWLPWTAKIVDEESARQFIERFLSKLAAADGVLFSIWVKHEMAGGFLLRTIDWGAGRTEIGFWIGQNYSGQGLVTRAAATVLDFIFDRLGLSHVSLMAALPNETSRAVAHRLGFLQEGVVRHAFAYSAGVLDHSLHGLLAEEWRNGLARAKYRPIAAL